MSDLAGMRRDYEGEALAPENTPDTPLPLFEDWLKQATESEGADANAMTLATVDSEGHPHARIVLLKGFDAQGFRFYTNYQSQKGNELAHVPNAAIVFWWPELQRQVRVEGSVEKVDARRAGLRVQQSTTPDPILMVSVHAAKAAMGTTASRTRRESACQTASKPRSSA